MGGPLPDRNSPYWRAANLPSVHQIYLYDDPLLKKPLTKEHITPRLLGTGGPRPAGETEGDGPGSGTQNVARIALADAAPKDPCLSFRYRIGPRCSPGK
jgi:XFP N-terminal domain